MTGIAAPWDIMGIKQGDSILYSHLSLTHGMIADIDIGYEDFRCVPRAAWMLSLCREGSVAARMLTRVPTPGGRGLWPPSPQVHGRGALHDGRGVPLAVDSIISVTHRVRTGQREHSAARLREADHVPQQAWKPPGPAPPVCGPDRGQARSTPVHRGGARRPDPAQANMRVDADRALTVATALACVMHACMRVRPPACRRAGSPRTDRSRCSLRPRRPGFPWTCKRARTPISETA